MTERETLTNEDCAAYLDELATMRPASLGADVWGEVLARAAAALRAPASEGEAVEDGAWALAHLDEREDMKRCEDDELDRHLNPYRERARAVLRATHPAPATVTEAMVEAGAKALVVGVNGLTEKGWENKDGDSWIEAVKAQAKKEMREVLLAALGGAR